MFSPAVAVVLSLVVISAEPPTPIAGTGRAGFSGDDGPAAAAELRQPFDVAYDRHGNLFISDAPDHRIRRVDAQTGVITTVAGTGEAGFSGDGGPATSARLNEPYGLAIAPNGDLFFADRLNRRVRRIDGRTGIIATVAGDGSMATSGDGGPGPEAGIVEPNGVALDGRGRLYIADVSGHRVRALDLASGRISTFAGDGSPRRSGDGGPAASASFFGPRAVYALPDGSVLIVERNGHSLRMVSPDGVVSAVAGGSKGYRGDGGPARDAVFDGPKELDVGPGGEILVVDTENHAIRRIAPDGVVTTAAAGLARPHGVAFTPDGGSFVVADSEHHRVVRVPLDVPPAERRP